MPTIIIDKRKPEANKSEGFSLSEHFKLSAGQVLFGIGIFALIGATGFMTLPAAGAAGAGKGVAMAKAAGAMNATLGSAGSAALGAASAATGAKIALD